MAYDDHTREHDPDPFNPGERPTTEVIPPDLDYLEPPRDDRRRVRRSNRTGRRSNFWRNLSLRLWRFIRTSFALILMVLAAIIGTALIVALVLYSSLAGELEEDIAALHSLSGVEDFQTTLIFDRDGDLLYEVFDEGRRTEVALDRIPFAVRWATIATEDDTFYENLGFDPQSIARAAWEWYQQGEIVSGGSTITQQLVRQIVFSYEERNQQTLRRKLKEAALAWVMTREYSKDDVLELYLNEVYYGNLAYGIEAAADIYFDKPAAELTIAESAFLAGLVQSPFTYDPYTNFEIAKGRQRQVLDLMVHHGYITQPDAEAAFAAPPLFVTDLANPDVSLRAPHFTVEVRRQLGELPGIEPEMIASGGLRVYTTVDMGYQNLAQRVAADQVAAIGEEFNLNNAAVIAINPHTGEVLAMLGSVDYEDETIDGAVNVVLSPQQPGSTMKPLTYAAALEQGWTAADIIWDVGFKFSDGVGGVYEPENYDNRFHGPVRLRDALANSYNIPAVYTLRDVTVPGLLEIAARLGMESLGDDASRFGLSLTLGGGEVTPLEMAQAFGAFANGGTRVEPVLITRVENTAGEVLYEAPPQPAEQILDERIAFLISDILSDNAARTPAMGSDSELLLDFPAAAKTGTTNDFRDNWTVGYTPHLVVAVWAGNTDNTPMADGTSGLTGAAPIWHDYMTAVYADPELTALLESPDLPPLRAGFAPPDHMEQQQVCELASLQDPVLAEEGCPRLRPEWFRIALPGEPVTPTVVPTPTWTPRPTSTPRGPAVIIGDDPAAQPPGEPLLVQPRVEVEPGITAISVLILTADHLAPMVDQINAFIDALPEAAPSLATPLYCEMNTAGAGIEAMTYQLFIEGPPDLVDAIVAHNWAVTNNSPIVPLLPCQADLINEIAEDEAEDDLPPIPEGVIYAISYPQANQGLFGIVPVLGTALFNPADYAYYKLEISGGPFEGWVTFGETHTTLVDDGLLETLHAEALPPGQYIIRLVIVGQDGNYVQPTFDVPITVLSEPPTPTPEPDG